MDKEKRGALLLEVRNRAGGTQVQFGKLIGIGSQSISNYEAGKPISSKNLVKYINFAREHGWLDLSEPLVPLLDDVATEKAVSDGNILLHLTMEEFDKLQEHAVARGFASARSLARDLVERELYGASLDRSKLTPEEATLIRDVLDVWRGNVPADLKAFRGVLSTIVELRARLGSEE